MTKLRRGSARLALTVAAAAMAVALSPSGLKAGFVLSDYDDFTDYEGLTNPEPADGTVNFALYKGTSTGNGLADLLADETPGAAVTLAGSNAPTGKYVYLYQVVNTNPLGGAEEPIDFLQILLDPSWVQAIGFFTQTVFNEEAPHGAVGPTSNPRLDEPLAADGLTGDSGAMIATLGKIESSQVEFRFDTATTSGLEQDEYSTVLFLVSDKEFVHTKAFLQDGGTAWGVTIAPVPVPASLAMLLGGLPGFAGLGLLLQRRKREAVVA